jgi:hypothetical protein
VIEAKWNGYTTLIAFVVGLLIGLAWAGEWGPSTALSAYYDLY